jgi:zinc protease
LTSGIDIDPAAADKIAEAVTALSAELHLQGVTEDELTRAKRPALTSIRESARSNAYWLNSVLARAQERPEVLAWARNREADMAGITKAEMDQLARTYLDPSRLSRAVIVPATTSGQSPAKPVANTP